MGKAEEAAVSVIVRWTASSDKEQCAQIIQTALDEARADERRAIVEWLLGPHGFDHCGIYHRAVADAIEKGRHLPPPR